MTVELLDRPPGDAGDDFDHVIEASIEVSSGRIAILGCTDYLPDAVRFELPEGFVRVRASRSNLANVRQSANRVTRDTMHQKPLSRFTSRSGPLPTARRL